MCRPRTRDDCFQVLLAFNSCITKLINQLKKAKLSKFSRLAASLGSNANALSQRVARILNIQENAGSLKLLDKWDMCNVLGISIDTFKTYKHKEGFPPGYDIGGKHQWLWDEVRDWIQANPWDALSTKKYTDNFNPESKKE